MDALLDSFISESDAMLHEIRALLDNMEAAVEQEKAEMIFRHLHAIKDSSELFDCPHITALTHAFEKSMYKILSGAYQPGKKDVAVFVKVTAVLRRMISEIEPGVHVDVKPMIEALSTVQNNSHNAAHSAPTSVEDIPSIDNIPEDSIEDMQLDAEIINAFIENVQMMDIENRVDNEEKIAIDAPVSIMREDESALVIDFHDNATHHAEVSENISLRENAEGLSETSVHLNGCAELCDSSPDTHGTVSDSQDEMQISCNSADDGREEPQELDDSMIHYLSDEVNCSTEEDYCEAQSGESYTDSIITDSSLLANLSCRLSAGTETAEQNTEMGTGDDNDTQLSSCENSTVPDVHHLPESHFVSGGVFLNYLASTLDRLEDKAVRLETSFEISDLEELKNNFYTIYCGGAHYSQTISDISKAVLCLLSLIEEKRTQPHFSSTDALLLSCDAIRQIAYGETPDLDTLEFLFSEIPYFEDRYCEFIPDAPAAFKAYTPKKIHVPEKYVRYAQKQSLYILHLSYSLERTNASTVIERLEASKKLEILKTVSPDENTLYVFAAAAAHDMKLSPVPLHRSVLVSPGSGEKTAETAANIETPILKSALFDYMQKSTQNGEILGLFDEMIQLSAVSGIESVKLIERIHNFNDQMLTGGYQ